MVASTAITKTTDNDEKKPISRAMKRQIMFSNRAKKAKAARAHGIAVAAHLEDVLLSLGKGNLEIIEKPKLEIPKREDYADENSFKAATLHYEQQKEVVEKKAKEQDPKNNLFSLKDAKRLLRTHLPTCDDVEAECMDVVTSRRNVYTEGSLEICRVKVSKLFLALVKEALRRAIETNKVTLSVQHVEDAARTLFCNNPKPSRFTRGAHQFKPMLTDLVENRSLLEQVAPNETAQMMLVDAGHQLTNQAKQLTFHDPEKRRAHTTGRAMLTANTGALPALTMSAGAAEAAQEVAADDAQEEDEYKAPNDSSSDDDEDVDDDDDEEEDA